MNRHGTNRFAIQQFKITYSNNLTDFMVKTFLHIDGRLVRKAYFRAGSSHEFLGPYNSACSVLPLKFQELQLVGTFSSIFPSFEHPPLYLRRKIQTSKTHPSLPKWGR